MAAAGGAASPADKERYRGHGLAWGRVCPAFLCLRVIQGSRKTQRERSEGGGLNPCGAGDVVVEVKSLRDRGWW